MARKPVFHFNPKTMTYQRIDDKARYIIRRVGSHAVTSLLSGFACFLFFSLFLSSPREKKVRAEKDALEAQLSLLNHQMDDVQDVLSDLQQRDDNMYRVVVEADPLPSSVRNYRGNAQKYSELRDKSTSDLAVSTSQKMDLVRREIYAQSKSYDDIIKMLKQKEDKLRCVPGIQPVMNKDLKCMASGYGVRIDPIYKTPRFHAGMDFSGNMGTHIFATGNGVVTRAGWYQGYGNAVVINHGYGYETLYGHLSKIKVRCGTRVHRGQVIAFMGSTGKSTGVHLHYEVHYRGKVVDPRHFYFMDLSPKDYDRMMQMTTNNGKIFD
jgi:hypothetical protein